MQESTAPALIDIGANLAHESFQADLDQVLSDAQAAGVANIMVTGTTVDTSRQALELARQHPGYLYCTAGIHPHDAKSFDVTAASELRRLAAHDEVRALGEMGLDFNRDYSPRRTQEDVFETQLELAAELGLPVFLHQRDAHDNFVRILERHRPHLTDLVVHCFTGDEEELAHYLDIDAYIGITGWICDERRGYHLHDILHRIPDDRLMLETDAPYLLPRNIRPKPKTRRNEPRHLVHVLAKVAEVLDEPQDQLAARTSANARAFFRL